MRSTIAKRFVSFLGASPYTPCKYLLRDARVEAVRFVQTALLHLVATNFGSDDSISIGCTAKPSQTNLGPLRSEILASGWLGPEIDTVDLPDATSEQEMWEIFEALMEQVRDGDELIFDITHSFRSLPMLFTVLIRYLRGEERRIQDLARSLERYRQDPRGAEVHNEIDVAFLAENRLYLVECKTKAGKGGDGPGAEALYRLPELRGEISR